MAGIIPFVALLLGDLILASNEEKDTNRKDRARELGRSIGDISVRVNDRYQTIQDRMPKDEAGLMVWTKAISEKSLKEISEAIGGFGHLAIPAMDGSKIDIPELYYRRFLMRKLELQLQAVQKSIKEALPAASALSSALITYDELASSGAITASQAAERKDRVVHQWARVDVQVPEVPSDEKIFEEFRKRDADAHVYMEEDPSLEHIKKWLASI